MLSPGEYIFFNPQTPLLILDEEDKLSIGNEGFPLFLIFCTRVNDFSF